jgi:hypothetical protein
MDQNADVMQKSAQDASPALTAGVRPSRRLPRPGMIFLSLVAVFLAVSARIAWPRHLTEATVKALEATCETVREAKIAPLREQAIKDCIAQPRSDPEFCRAHFKDFGAPHPLKTGKVAPRMFHDLPECTQAWEARQHFNFYPP